MLYLTDRQIQQIKQLEHDIVRKRHCEDVYTMMNAETLDQMAQMFEEEDKHLEWEYLTGYMEIVFDKDLDTS